MPQRFQFFPSSPRFFRSHTIALSISLKKYLGKGDLRFKEALIRGNGDCVLTTTTNVDVIFYLGGDMLNIANDFFSLANSDIFKERKLEIGDGFEQIDYIDLRFGKKIFYKLKAQ